MSAVLKLKPRVAGETTPHFSVKAGGNGFNLFDPKRDGLTNSQWERNTQVLAKNMLFDLGAANADRFDVRVSKGRVVFTLKDGQVNDQLIQSFVGAMDANFSRPSLNPTMDFFLALGPDQIDPKARAEYERADRETAGAHFIRS